MEQKPKPTSEIVFYQTEDGRTRLEVKLENETVWLTQAQMAELFQTTPQNMTLHLQAIYEEGELNETATCKDYLQVRAEGARQVQRALRHYNLEAILAVGYRVRSARGTTFRQWASAQLKEYLVKGFVMDDERLKNPGPDRPDYFDEILERIRDIRSAEKRMLKRGIRGTYVSVEPFHLFRYLDEQAFRFNERETTDSERFLFLKAMPSIVGRRLTYKGLTGNVDLG